MKKITSILFAILSIALIFTACEGPQGTTPKDAETVNAMSVYYSGPVDYKFPTFCQFTFEGYTGTVTYNPHGNVLEGDGYVIQVSQALSFCEDYMPTSTSFVPFEIVGETVEDVFSGGAIAIQYFVIENGKINQDASAFTYDFDVKLSKKGEKYIISIEGDFDGEVKKFYFEGTPTIYNDSRYLIDGVESEKVVNETANFAQAQVIYYSTYETPILPYNLIEVQLVDKNMTTLANFYCYGSLDNAENVYGTFTVSSDVKVGSASKSAGTYTAEDGNSYASPSFLALNYNNQSGAADYYLVNGGTITISEGGISFDLTSLNGSKIKSNYTGKIDILSLKQAYGAPQAKAPMMKKAEKTLEPLNYNPIKLF